MPRALLLAAIAALALAAPAAAGPPRPHLILLLTLDTTRADHLSVYGYGRPTAPALTGLAAAGVRVQRAVTPMPMTDPAHASILTGLHPRTHGVRLNGHALPDPTLPTLASWARGLGYRTAAFISRAHLRPSEVRLQGFEHEDGPPAPQRVGRETLAAAMGWIREHVAEPLFVWVHLFDPHVPYAPPRRYRTRFAETPDGPPPLLGNTAKRPLYTPEQVRTLTALYDAEIAYTDDLAGRLVALVHEVAPPGNPPLVVVAGDHGETLGERDATHRYAFDHGQLLYQDVLEVPLLLRRDGALPAGRVLPGPVSLVDVAPTLFELVGAPGFATQGRSLVAEIHGHEPPGTRLAFSERRRLSFGKQLRWRSLAQFSVQDRRFKLILSTPFSRTELYDLVQDPGETRDLARALPAVEAALRGAIERWRAGPTAAADGDATVPPEKEDALRALGYVE